MQITDILTQVPPAFTVLAGDDGMALPTLALGGAGLVSVASNALPRQVAAMVHARPRQRPRQRLARRPRPQPAPLPPHAGPLRRDQPRPHQGRPPPPRPHRRDPPPPHGSRHRPPPPDASVPSSTNSAPPAKPWIDPQYTCRRRCRCLSHAVILTLRLPTGKDSLYRPSSLPSPVLRRHPDPAPAKGKGPLYWPSSLPSPVLRRHPDPAPAKGEGPLYWPLPLPVLRRHPERSEGPASVLAFAFASLAVIPAGNLLLPFTPPAPTPSSALLRDPRSTIPTP